MNKDSNIDTREIDNKQTYNSIKNKTDNNINLKEIAIISTFPPKVCGIGTYTQDLKKSLNSKFGKTFNTQIIPIETNDEDYEYPVKIDYILKNSQPESFAILAKKINQNPNIEIVMLQHEFGLFIDDKGGLLLLLKNLEKDIVVTFHTVLPKPNLELRTQVETIAFFSKSIIVMTSISAQILSNDYDISLDKITIIPHGTHLLPSIDKAILKEKYGLQDRQVLSTFGLLGSGKNIETTLLALPDIIADNNNVVFLIIGKTHPSIIKHEGEKYREYLEEIIRNLQLEKHVIFINAFLPLDKLLDYLQLTDVYLFTSKDRNQAVSGTFSYAISCGCPIVSTPIPHALEVLKDNAGIVIDFEAPLQLSTAVNTILKNKDLQENLRVKSLEKMAPTAWENSAISHALLFHKLEKDNIEIKYSLPNINLDHIYNLTTNFGMIQFSKISKPDLESGYTLDDNARAMIAVAMHYKSTKNIADLKMIATYLNVIQFCQQSDGSFLNYVDKYENFTKQNDETNLEDSNGRAVWALGYLISLKEILPKDLSTIASEILEKSLLYVESIHSTRAMAFIIKGLYYQNSSQNILLMKELANRLTKMYQHESSTDWQWFESYLTYANSLLPEALLMAYKATNIAIYKQIAYESFNFLLSKIFTEHHIKVISNKNWTEESPLLSEHIGGEQPIDVAYTILTLSSFYKESKNQKYLILMKNAFDWFLGKNHLNQIIYNPITGGCYDGLEEHNVNLNQGAESTVSYLMARLCMDK